MSKSYEGTLLGEGLKFGVVVARFNEFITGRLLEGARDGLARHGVKEDDVEVAWTPGSFEIPLIAKRMAESGKYSAVIVGRISSSTVVAAPARSPLSSLGAT